MASTRASVLCMGLLAGASAAQEPPARPNFTGLWKSVPGPKGGDTFARIIDHSPTHLSVIVNTGAITVINCDFERKECTETGGSGSAQRRPAEKSRLKVVDWEGDTLVLRTLVGGAFATDERWQLSPDAKTLTIRVTVHAPTPTGAKEIDAGVAVWKKQE